MTDPAPCIRCGDFLAGARVAVPGIPLCRTCLEAKREAGEVIGVFPPRRVLFLRLAVVGSAMAVGAILGVLVGFLVFGGGFWVMIGGTVGLVLGELSVITVFFSRTFHLGILVWKRAVIGSFGLERAPEDAFAFAMFSPRHIKFTNMKIPVQIGLLAESEHGLAFLGTRDARVVVPFAEVTRVTTGRLHFFPPRTFVRLDLRDGTGRWFSYYQLPTFRANRAATEALAARIQARLVASPTRERAA